MTLDRHIIADFIPILLASISFFSLTVILIDLLMNLWKFMQEGVSVKDVAKVYALYAPKAIWYALPLASLFAATLTISDLYARNEMTSIFASGVPLFRVALPLILLSALCAPLLFIFDDKIVSLTYAKKTALQRALLHEEKPLDCDKPVVLCEGGRIIYRAEFYDDKEKCLLLPLIIFRDDSGECLSIIKARSAKWDDKENRWQLDKPIQYLFTESGKKDTVKKESSQSINGNPYKKDDTIQSSNIQSGNVQSDNTQSDNTLSDNIFSDNTPPGTVQSDNTLHDTVLSDNTLSIEGYEGGGVLVNNDIDDAFLLRLNENASTFRSSDISVEEVSAASAALYIDHLRKAGLPYAESLSLYYKKFSFPCVLLIVALLAVGLSGRTSKNISLVSLALSISTAVLFYILQMITMLMAKFGTLSPLAGAWSPVISFTILSFIAIATTRT